MKPCRLIAAVVLAVATAALAQVQIPAVPAGELIRIVVANELRDRVQQRRWMYVIEKRVGAQLVTEEQVETSQGPLFRVQAIDGIALTADQRQLDDARIGRLLHDPSQLLKLKQQHEQDEQKLENLMRVMADAFLYEYAGDEGGLVRLTFRPNPNYDPPTYEIRVVHSLAGAILIDQQQNRLTKLTGRLIERVQFGYGLLGHIDNSGTIEFGRVQVGPAEWKTAVIRIDLSGRMVFFKTISKQENETRSNFRAVSGDLSLVQASNLLAR